VNTFSHQNLPPSKLKIMAHRSPSSLVQTVVLCSIHYFVPFRLKYYNTIRQVCQRL
jgi:hypothetical protein